MNEEQIKSMKEAISPLLDRIDALEQKNAALEAEQKDMKNTLAARVEAEQKERFLSKLKPAFHQKADALWAECQQAGYLEFEAKHPEMIQVMVQTAKLNGNPMDTGKLQQAEEFNLAKSQDKLWGRV